MTQITMTDNLQWMRGIAREGDVVRILDAGLASAFHSAPEALFTIQRLTSGWYWGAVLGISFELLLDWLDKGEVCIEHKAAHKEKQHDALPQPSHHL